MTNKLQEFFPMLKSRREVLAEIYQNRKMKIIFESWSKMRQNEFLDFCTGAWGVKTMYDFMAKELLNPEISPERLNEILSFLLGQRVRIVLVLPNDSVRIADEGSLLVTDIVVELEDGSIANIEIQRFGYAFPGQRSACYTADLLLRQYKRVRGEKKKNFSYKDVKNVYTIVFLEKSSKEFHEFPEVYIHHFWPKSDTGLQLELLQNHIFIPLDIFRKIQHNKPIKNKLDAWLAFLSMDDPETIVSIIEAFPEFETIYRQIFNICQNIERGMEMFSEELKIMDRNTVKYMMDEMQEEINLQKEQLSQQEEQLSQQEEQLSQQEEQLSRQKEQLSQKDEQLSIRDKEILEIKAAYENMRKELDALKSK